MISFRGVLVVIFALYVVGGCVYIEVLDTRAGGAIEAKLASEEAYKRWRIAADGSGWEKAQVCRALGGVGVALHLVGAALLLIGGISVLIAKSWGWRVFYGLGGMLGLGCLFWVVHREYYAVLGW